MSAAMPAPDLLAQTFLDELKRHTADPPGVTRDAYGPGEAAAQALLHRHATELGLDVTIDHAGNLYATLPGRDREAPRWIIGSHLDSVPHGGNFDGAAGIAAGLALLADIGRGARMPARAITLMAIRAEESTWFPASYIGSRAAFGLLRPDELALRRSDTGRTLDAHLRESGFDPDRLMGEPPALLPAQVHGFIEVHIEQGPTLVLENKPIGLVSAIAGSFRYREAAILGIYGHSGAVSRKHRSDAVFAFADFVAALDGAWNVLEAAGAHATVTFGEVGTDPELHAFSKVPGEVRFSLDVRSGQTETLDALHRTVAAAAGEIAARRGVTFAFGPLTGSTPALLSTRLGAALAANAQRRGIAHLVMPSGAGHDAAVFAQMGVPTAMVFVRNENGSHNPDEAMRMEDLACARAVLTDLLLS
ncbi:MAG TPA: Zn-dependent hydrolase [Xanthobacteraceae bacterium]|nr:Zn-dependent hydrolase [Xanthobacteraceae bacterium]